MAERKLKSKRSFALVTDSASDISPEAAEIYNINIIPILIHYGSKEFKDGIDIDPDKIYRLQKEEKAIFTSSSPSPYDFVQVYEKLLEEYEKIISIHISSKLSAVIKSALIAKQMLKAEKRIKIFDSFSGAMGTGFMVLTAARAISRNYSYQKILNILGFLKDNISLYGTIDTLKYLRRSGRVPAVASIISGIFKIKPLLGIKNGVVKMIGIAITRYGSIMEITRRVIRDFKKEEWVIVSIIHTLSIKESEKIMKKIKSSLKCLDVMTTECTPVIGAHTGPGLIGIIVSRLNQEIADLYM
jgi:DegV family protein with EDD domain